MAFVKFLQAGLYFVPVVVSVFFLCALPAQAQTMTGSIIGVIQDTSGGVMVGVQTTLTSPQLPGGPRNTLTNERGEYRFTGLQPGIYALRVESGGFSTYEETDLRVLTGGTTERIVTLQISTTVTTITVSGEAPVIDLHLAGIQNSIRISKSLFNEGSRRVELAGEIKNLLQEKEGGNLQSTVYNASNFLNVDSYPEPRQLRLLARLVF